MPQMSAQCFKHILPTASYSLCFNLEDFGAVTFAVNRGWFLCAALGYVFCVSFVIVSVLLKLPFVILFFSLWTNKSFRFHSQRPLSREGSSSSSSSSSSSKNNNHIL
jgi:hypothetical protein